MALPVYSDVHVPAGVTQGLRRKALDALTAQDDKATRKSDEQLLQRAADLGRVLLTQDSDFLGIASRWQSSGRAFAGIQFAPQGTPLGRMIDDVDLCLTCLTVDELRNRVIHLPLQ